VIEQIADESEVQETRDLGAAVALALRFLRATASVVIERYQEERQLLDDVRSSAEQSTLSDLLAGTYSPDAHPNDQLAATYAVVRLGIGPNDDERTGGFGASVAAHRKLRRVRAAVDQMEIEGIISGLTATGGTLLVPLSTDSGAPIDDSVGVLDDLVGRVGDASQAPVHAATADAPAPLGIAEAARLCDDILDVLQTTRRPPGLYRLDDVKLDVQLSRPGPARRLLAASLQPIAVRPALLTTLRTYLADGMNRRRTALDLGVHPNTVDYRLRKIAALTGLDPTDPGDAFTFTACLHAHDTESGPPDPGRAGNHGA
jgi:hypothetical protein